MRCLYCYQELADIEKDFHPACSKNIFGQPTPPELPFTEKEMEELALKVIRSQVTVTGVQPKLPLDIQKTEGTNEPKRFTIVGLFGNYILKPPTQQYPHLPEIEDLTMHLASIVKIKTVPHSLIRMQSGELAYITKRIDRNKKNKLHMEDFCQLTEQLTEHKDRGSYEQIAKAIHKYSANPGLDVVNFYEQVLFSFLTGNADMHLKNFSLLHNPTLGPVLAPAYDMVATKLLIKDDNEEMSLHLKGKKNRLSRKDFIAAFTLARLDSKQQTNIFKKMEKAVPAWMNFIDISFMSDEYKGLLKEIINERFNRVIFQ